MFDLYIAKVLYGTRVITNTIFITYAQVATSAVFRITLRKDSIIHTQLNGPNLILYIYTTLQDNDLAIKFVE